MIYLAIVVLAIVWASWHLSYEWMQRNMPIPEPPHCCECEQFDRKCEAAERGVQFLSHPVNSDSTAESVPE